MFNPCCGRIPHASGQLGPCATVTEPVIWGLWATTTEPTCPRACALQQEKPLQWEAVFHNQEQPPFAATGESPIATVKTQHKVINKINKIIKNNKGPLVKNSLANAGNTGLIPGLGRYPREGNGSPLQYSCLEYSMDRGAWWATVHGVGKSQTQLSNWAHTQDTLKKKSHWLSGKY